MNGEDDARPAAEDPARDAAEDPSDPFGDKKFLSEKRLAGGPAAKGRRRPKGGVRAIDSEAEKKIDAAGLAASHGAGDAIEALRLDVMSLERVDVERLAAAEDDQSRGEYDLKWTPGADGLPPHCPVTPLGKKRGVFFFLTPDCELIELAAGNFGQAHIDALFAPQTNYLMMMYGATSAKSNTKRIKYEGVRRNLMDACGRRGVFDPADKVRGRGAWKNADGRLVLHQGDVILIDGAAHAPGVHGEFVYPARPRLAPPLGDGLAEARAAARRLLLYLQCWSWRGGALDARLMLGWIVASLMGAAIDWRPQVMVTGDSGTGKSTLEGLIKAVMGDRLLDVADATAAALYQTLGQDALAVAFDEFENEDDARGAAVMRLARLASSGGRVARGGADGVPTNYQARGSFKFSAINPPSMRPAEQNRTTILALKPHAEGARAPIVSAREAEEIGRMLVARILHMWSFWPERFDCFRAKLAAIGHSNRGQDQFGTLLAAADLALNESSEGLNEEWPEIAPMLAPSARGETSGALPNWRRCLNHALACQPDAWKGVKFKQVGQALAAYDAADPEAWSTHELQTRLGYVGLALVVARGAGEDEYPRTRWLGFPQRHPALAKAFEGTDWSARRGADGAWIGAISQAPEDAWRRGVFRVAGAKERGLLVRLDVVLEQDEDDAKEEKNDE
ncbi:MAG: hypothetical protein BroJett013_30350 [Alphaproteobacteria bacterium]|nr:MAG: hypothetical protein BroJett013_30350 [Alphaproteobacteria bacterium]